MNNRQKNHRTIQGLGQLTLGLLVCLVCLVSITPVVADELAVPAEFIRYIKMPGSGDTILRPTAVHFDPFHDEVLVGDSGHNRILIFGANGVFRFSFSLNEIMTMPRDITTDAQGYIFVLGSNPGGQVLQRFDFDGSPAGSMDVPAVFENIGVELRYLACDGQGSLFGLDHEGRRVLTFGEDGAITHGFSIERDPEVAPLVGDDASRGKGAYALGSFAFAAGTFFVPVSNSGKVLTFATDGTFLGSVGNFGSKPGSLNFPVAVEVSSEGLILILDRARYCVVCFSPDKKFLGEFGGKGTRPGWFMGPSLLAVPAADRAIIGQIFRNKIQVCTVPEFIRAKAGQVSSEPAADAVDISVASTAAGIPAGVSQRRSSANSRPIGFPSRDGEFPPSNSNNALIAQNGSYPEVSE